MECLAKSSFLTKVFVQVSHSNGLAPSWTNFTWVTSRARRLNALPQCSHVKPFSPVWWKIWARSWDAWMKLLPQNWQECGLWPVCVRTWRLSVSLAAKRAWHCVERKLLLLLCTRLYKINSVCNPLYGRVKRKWICFAVSLNNKEVQDPNRRAEGPSALLRKANLVA